MQQRSLKKILNSNDLKSIHTFFIGFVIILLSYYLIGFSSVPIYFFPSVLVLIFLLSHTHRTSSNTISRTKNILSILFDEWNDEIVFQSPTIDKVFGFRPENVNKMILSNIFSTQEKKEICYLLNSDKPSHVNFKTRTVSGEFILVNFEKLYHKSKAMVIADFEYVKRKDLDTEVVVQHHNLKVEIKSRGFQIPNTKTNKHKHKYTFELSNNNLNNKPLDYKAEPGLLDKMLKTTPFHHEQIILSEIDMNDVIVEACKSLKGLIDETKTEICYEGLPSVQADAVQMTHLMKNLIKNSIQYRTNSIPQISIDFQQMDEELIFCVNDNGVGINTDTHTQIFTPYYRLNHDGRIIPGIGLGLAVCKYIINNHKGSIWCENGDFHGSRFYFSLPTPFAIPISRMSESYSQPCQRASN